MDDLNSKIGTVDTDGNVTEWPKRNINGGEYTPPSNRIGVGVGRFVVLPPGFTAWEKVDEIKAALTTSAPKSKAKVSETNGA